MTNVADMMRATFRRPHPVSTNVGDRASVVPLYPQGAREETRFHTLYDAADQALVDIFGQRNCLSDRVLPWKKIAGETVILVATLDDYEAAYDRLHARFGRTRPKLSTRDEMDHLLQKSCQMALRSLSEHRTPYEESCRGWRPAQTRFIGLGLLLSLTGVTVLWPAPTVLALVCLVSFWLFLNTLMKIAALGFHGFGKTHSDIPVDLSTLDLPVVTLFLPLFHERDIARHLVKRVQKLDYPAEKLDVCLLVEEVDAVTRAALETTKLPANFRAITVPKGGIQTKPRAMNYALAFARGSIIGIYDAEDAPDSDHILKIAARFHDAAPELACLQGRLDFYNSKTNWLSRCFTIEYATWFHMILPALQKLGMPVPLGGTTLFFRKDILEDLGGWDAHNVTEDADLGVRLSRHGYKTELIDIRTQEEANARTIPWIRQRSRWLKGYAITYAVHMRHCAQLWRGLGPAGFLGFQVLFLGSLIQIALAPVLWSFWLLAFGLAHPLSGLFNTPLGIVLTGSYILAEVVSIIISIVAVRSIGKPELAKFAPSLMAYFPLATLAIYKGLFELTNRPFYWDKTAHGVFTPTEEVHAQNDLSSEAINSLSINTKTCDERFGNVIA